MTKEKVLITAIVWVMSTGTQKMKEWRVWCWVLAWAAQTRILKLEWWECGTGQGHYIQLYATLVYVIICMDDAHWMQASYADVASHNVLDWVLFMWPLCSHTTLPGIAMLYGPSKWEVRSQCDWRLSADIRRRQENHVRLVLTCIGVVPWAMTITLIHRTG